MNGSRSQGRIKLQSAWTEMVQSLYLCLNLVSIPSFLSYRQASFDTVMSRM